MSSATNLAWRFTGELHREEGFITITLKATITTAADENKS